MKLNVAVQMDPIARINIKGDSTFALLLEAQKRGHGLSYYTPDKLSMVGEEIVAPVQLLTVRDEPGNHFTLGEPRREALNGFDVVREIGPTNMPATIFVTAYDQHALGAFDLAALDYLVKPFDDDRFEEALRRARRAVELEEVDRLRGQLLAALQANPTAPQAAEPAYLERVAVESKGKVRIESDALV